MGRAELMPTNDLRLTKHVPLKMNFNALTLQPESGQNYDFMNILIDLYFCFFYSVCVDKKKN